MTTTINKSDDLTASVGSFLGSLHHKVGETKTLHDLGVNNELASYVHDFFSDPLKGLMESNSASLKGIKKLVQNLVGRLFSSQKDSIIKAFSVDVEAQIVYYICIKQDSAKARAPYFEFLEFYEELGVKNRLPLYFKFVPERVLDKVDLKEIEIK